jgi:hypothetical protein
MMTGSYGTVRLLMLIGATPALLADLVNLGFIVSVGIDRSSFGLVGGALELGIGAEWFPFHRVSLGGTTGLNAGYLS